MSSLPMNKGGGELKRVIIDNGGSSFNSKTSNDIDIKTALPNVYDKLTLDNFALVNTKVNHEAGQSANGSSYLPTSYDPSTGILNCGKSANYNTGGSGYTKYTWYLYYKIAVFYVE